MDVQELFRLWHDKTLTSRMICDRLRVSADVLRRLARRYALPKRGHTARLYRKSEPTIEEIYARAAEVRSRRPWGSKEDEAAAYTIPCYGGKPW